MMTAFMEDFIILPLISSDDKDPVWIQSLFSILHLIQSYDCT